MVESLLRTAFPLLGIGNDYILGIYRDELEVEYLRVLTIVKPPVTDRAT